MKFSFTHLQPLNAFFKYFKHLLFYVNTGIQGTTTFIDQNGDAEGNYTLLARVEIHDSKYSMQPVGHFQSSDGCLPVIEVNFLDLSRRFIF